MLMLLTETRVLDGLGGGGGGPLDEGRVVSDHRAQRRGRGREREDDGARDGGRRKGIGTPGSSGQR